MVFLLQEANLAMLVQQNIEVDFTLKKIGLIICAAALFSFIHFLTKWNSTRQRLKKLGQKAPSCNYWAPFGTGPDFAVFSHITFPDLILGFRN